MKKLGRCTLAEESAHKIVGTIHKILHEHTPDSISELIRLRNSAYNLRGKDMLKLPKVNTTKYELKSWKYYGPKLWNNLSDEIKSSTSYAAFKRMLLDIDIQLEF